MKKILYVLFVFIISTNILFATQRSQEDIDLDFYLNDVIKICKKNWQPPIRSYSYNIVTNTEINNKGEIIDCKIIKSSGDKNIDDYAIEAIKKSQPFAPLPKSFTGKCITVQNTLYSTVISDLLLIKYVKDDNSKAFLNDLANKPTQKAYKNYTKLISNQLSLISPEKYQKQKKITVEFDVNNKGTTENVKIIQKSDSAVFDKKIIKGLQEISFAPYPRELQNSNIEKIHLKYSIKTNIIQPMPYPYPVLLPIPIYH